MTLLLALLLASLEKPSLTPRPLCEVWATKDKGSWRLTFRHEAVCRIVAKDDWWWGYAGSCRSLYGDERTVAAARRVCMGRVLEIP